MLDVVEMLTRVDYRRLTLEQWVELKLLLERILDEQTTGSERDK